MLGYTKDQLAEYKKELDIVASLSNLFSDNTAPMIYYRATENIYCRSFNAINVSRSDCTADAIFDLKVGVGIKTFLYKASGSYQKIAEFNRQQPLFRGLTGIDLVKKIASLRNERIATTIRTYGLKSMIYHCITRQENGTIEISEEPMHSIDIDKIRITAEEPNKIMFTDGIENYEFYHSKSTLFKYFSTSNVILSFKVVILADPMEELVKLVEFLTSGASTSKPKQKVTLPFLIVPLYSENKTKGKFIPEKSGLNQWNAGGRARHPDEVYIPFPKQLRDDNPDFFPERYSPWNLRLPNGKTITMTVCQESGKALMSNPNKELGKWLLRDVLHLDERHLLTYDELLAKGIDSVIFWKRDDTNFTCDFVDSETLEE